MKKLNVALVGLGFGGAFLPIYVNHPDVEEVGIFDLNGELAKKFADRYGIRKVYGSFEEILEDDRVDAVHLVTPIPLHEEQTVRVLEAGKHCACTVPMAMSVAGIRRIIETVKRTGKKYMMMETSVYTKHYFHAKEMLENGEFGNIQLVKGAHYQDMEYWPDYWMGLPPMYYGTHAIAPMVMFTGSPIVKTHCFGSGYMREELKRQYHNPFPVECAIFEFENGLKGEATRSLFHTARNYIESFDFYGEKASFEWQQIDWCENPVVFRMVEEENNGRRGRDVTSERIELKNYDHLLPEEIRKYTVKNQYYDETNPQLTFVEGGGHGGSHPHMVHEFIRSILEDRKAWTNEIVGGNICAAGICAHESALKDGALVEVPDFQEYL